MVLQLSMPSFTTPVHDAQEGANAKFCRAAGDVVDLIRLILV